MFFNYDLNFDIPMLIWLILYTYGIFFWLFKLKNRLIQAFYVIFVTGIFVYSGVGASLEGVYSDYYLYYCGYMGVFSLCSFLFINKDENVFDVNYSKLISDLFDRIGTPIIILYILISFAYLIHPEMLLNKLFSPPKPDIGEALSLFLNSEEPQDGLTRFFTFTKNLLLPFFIISLYKYKNQPIVLSLIWFVPVYITYCANSYLGRTEIATSILTFVVILYNWNPQYRKFIFITSLILGVIALPLFVVYQEMRSGANIGNLSFIESLTLLGSIELTFPHFFEQIIQYSEQGINHVVDYIEYLVMMIVPSFLRFGNGDFNVNYTITALITGEGDASHITWVILTGIVGESVFLFGKSLFWLHAVIVSFVFSMSLNYFAKCDHFKVFLIYCVTSVSPFVARGGTAGSFPLLIKGVVYLSIAIWFFKTLSRINSNGLMNKIKDINYE